MPLYVVRCPQHGEVEVLCRTWRERPTTCPQCGQVVATVPTAANAVFKGAGFHAVDYPKAASK